MAEAPISSNTQTPSDSNIGGNNYEIKQSYSLNKLWLSPLMPGIRAGDSKLNTLKNAPINLMLAFKEVVLLHDIDEMCNSGYIVITERGNLMADLPIVGWERIDIEFSIMVDDKNPYENTEQPIYKRHFYVYAVDTIVESGVTKQYVIRFVSLSALLNIASRIEKRYKGKAETIIQEICNLDSLKAKETEPTAETAAKLSKGSDPSINLKVLATTDIEMDYVAPCCKPLEFVNRLTQLAATQAENAFSDCMFYQQVDGTYEFNSYKNIISSSTTTEVSKQPSSTEDSAGGRTLSNGLYSIVDYNFNRLFNSQESNGKGMFGNITKVMNMTTMSIYNAAQTYSEKGYNESSGTIGSIVGELGDILAGSSSTAIIKDNLLPKNVNDTADNSSVILDVIKDNRCMLNENSTNVGQRAIKQSTGAVINTVVTGVNQSDVGIQPGVLSPNDLKLQIAKQHVALGYGCNMNMRVVSLTLKLNPCLGLKLGQKIKLNMNDGGDDSQPMSEFLNGEWFIGKIRYSLRPEEIVTHIECYSNNMLT